MACNGILNHLQGILKNHRC